MHARNITHHKESFVTIQYVDSLLAQIRTKELIEESNVWIYADNGYDLNAYDSSKFEANTQGCKYIVYQSGEQIATGDIDLYTLRFSNTHNLKV